MRLKEVLSRLELKVDLETKELRSYPVVNNTPIPCEVAGVVGRGCRLSSHVFLSLRVQNQAQLLCEPRPLSRAFHFSVKSSQTS